MATVSITVPDAMVTRINDAFATAFEYPATIDGEPNPETKTQHTRRRVREYVAGIVRRIEAGAAAQTAAASTANQVNTDMG